MNVELFEIMGVLCAALNIVILVWFQGLIFASLGYCKFLFVSWMHFIYFINGCYEVTVFSHVQVGNTCTNMWSSFMLFHSSGFKTVLYIGLKAII
jgi:hypothetical protein